MPYLNWKEDTDESQLKQSIESTPSGVMKMVLALDRPHVDALLPILGEVLSAEAAPGAELRVDLPRGWIIFWKRREGESRLLLAHPQENEWVATAALIAEHGQALVSSLDALTEGSEFGLKSLGALGAMSNLELHLARL